MVNIHQMKTRSNKDKDKDKDKEKNQNNDNKGGDNSDDEYDEIDEYGNLKGFIDYDCDEPFDKNMFNEEIDRLKKKRKGNTLQNPILQSPIKKSRSNLDLSKLLINYMVKNANEIKKKNDKEKKKNIVVKEDTDEDEEEQGQEEQAEEEIDDSYSDIDLSSDSDTDILSQPSSDESEEKYDEYDNEYDDLIYNKGGQDDFEYFKNLTINSKKNILIQMKEINTINDRNVPLKFKILHSDMNMHTKSIAISQIDKIEELDPSSGEYGKVDQWINGLIQIPFQKYIELPINDNSDSLEKKLFLKNTNDILDKAIYGHRDAKSHILQVVSKWIKNPKSSGNILALQGPMGNGKTTLVKEGIAKAINRPFAFITLGGASDSSFFDGHNFTYEGSRWGRIVEILIESKCMNPIFYFDELDKVSDTYKGQEIIHLLTHLTDQSQNDRFQDNYFSGINLDLSKALFIFSFNDEHKIDRILKDRMYVINTKGFNTKDKIEIANNYLLPELLNTFKYHDTIVFNNDIIEHIIDNFTHKEQGVRNLKRCLETIISKVNMYELLYDKEKKCCEINLPYEIENFSIPYHVQKDDLDILLKKVYEEGKPPEHMYV